jgi:hypothetical protein
VRVIIIIIIIWSLFGVNDFASKRIQARSGWVDQFLSEKKLCRLDSFRLARWAGAFWSEWEAGQASNIFQLNTSHSMGLGGFLFPNEAYYDEEGREKDNTALGGIDISRFHKRICLNEEDALARKVTELAGCPA